MDIHPITLIGRFVRLEPISEAHIPDLAVAGADDTIWTYMPYGPVVTGAKMRGWVLDLLERQKRGGDLPFAVIHLRSGRAAGSTRYMEINRPHRWLEIGGTWYGKDYRRTAVNTECKYLLLRHAFEVLGCLRVQLKTDLRNERSQLAIERIGAVREGVWRKHMIMPDGYPRSSVMYSILDDEWPAVKAKLEAMLGITG
jgi:RimJ/RimL family protein N-acetyltransferase